ncbi:MAG: asparagine synthase C-terminal domain-containing protein [Thiobacillaceae bacterium]|nr:asparagine synthase C-terminal domain-containing protein [Thiobacillaceae bacterium]
MGAESVPGQDHLRSPGARHRRGLFPWRLAAVRRAAQAAVFPRVQAAPTDDPLSLVQYLDMKTYLVGDILTKVDRASMAHALEVREPLLDHELMGWVSGLPVDLKLRGTEGKYLLKKSMEPYLPHDVLYRKKMGFSVPLEAWFRGPLAATIRSVVLGERLAATGLFNQDYLREVVEAHQSGRRDYSVILWTVLMFDAFLGQVLGMDEAERRAA